MNPPTQFNASHQTTSFSCGQTIQFVHVVRREVVQASYNMLEDLLVKTGVGTQLGAGTTVPGRSPNPSHCGTTIVETLASRSEYSLPTIRQGVAESLEQFGGLEVGSNLFAGINVPLSQEAEANIQSSGIDGSLTLPQVIEKPQVKLKSRKKTY